MSWWPFSAKAKAREIPIAWGGVPRSRSTAPGVRAKFDAAQTTADNRRHWANADSLAPDAAATPSVRQVLRNRARYEIANNSYARGIVLTLANDVVGTGPRLQMLLEEPAANALIEREFAAWARAMRLAARLRTLQAAKVGDGETFTLLFSAPGLPTPVKLNIGPIEADQVASPIVQPSTPRTDLAALASAVDGIEFDADGRPAYYYVLKSHPGGTSPAMAFQADRVAAKWVIHWFRADRPGQSRGLPEIMPALPLFAQLRRYTAAVIAAAESVANIAVVMKTTAPAGGEAAEVEQLAEMEFSPNMAVFAPEGWDPEQIKAEQPATTYPQFKAEILNEIARCLNMPFNIAAGNSSSYNYASGRLDHQTYFKSIRVEQSELEAVVLDRVLDAWMAEAVKVYPELADVVGWPHQWFWEGREHVDPLKEASAQETRLADYATNLALEYARQGKDWETELRQRARELALMGELKLPAPVRQPVAPPAQDAADAGTPGAGAGDN